MIHGPCGAANRSAPCMDKDRRKCTKYFPKKFVEATTIDDEGYPVYRRRDNGRVVVKNGVPLDNRYVVPHNRYLLMKYGAHINVEWCNQSRSIKYHFKYINKGNDRVTASFYGSTGNDGAQNTCDEIKMYYDCRYISPCEAAWRIFMFDIQFRSPAVERLSFHLLDEQNVIFSDSDPIDVVLERPTAKQSMFLAWFEANKKYPELAKDLTYAEFPTKFVWKEQSREWCPRRKGYAIGRLSYIPPGTGELYYERCLLNIVRGAKCFEDMRTIGGNVYSTFRDASYSLGLLNDDNEYIDGIKEASQWASATSLRNLFAILLATDSLTRPGHVWNNCWSYLSDDILHKRRTMLQHLDLLLTEDEIKGYALAELEKLLRSLGKSLRDFADLPFPSSDFLQMNQNRLIFDELQYDRVALDAEYRNFLQKCTGEQRHVHDTILNAVNSELGGMFFVYGYGGTGKTFLWKGLSAALRSKGEIVINVASSGIASLLLPGGRTAHSRFKIPLNLTEDSTCNINQGSDLANLMIKAKLIIWDEAPMMHKFCFEALDRTLRDIMRFSCPSSCDVPFGVKTVVFGGDFRQILPVIPKGTRQDIVHATINASYLWKSCTVLRLTKNMRLQNSEHNEDSIQLEQFADWIASIGDGTLGEPNDGETKIELPNDMVIPYSGNPIAAIVDEIYSSSSNCIESSTYLQERAVLAPTLNLVESINQYMISLKQSEGKEYLSSDSTCMTDSTSSFLEQIHTPEFLNGLKCSGVPNHQLFLKVGTPVMLLRNINHANGLCNGTRLVITRLGNHVLEAKVITGQNAENKVIIPRMSLTPSDSRLPFKFQRKQFPIIVSYAMTINKNQGQSLSRVGLFLEKPVFTHGQLYVAVSQVTNRNGLRVLISGDDGKETATTNVIYKEVLQNV